MVAVDVRMISDFLCSVNENPSALIIEGEAGIGKTTLWLAGVEQARARGFTVLVTRPVAAETVLAYASLADLLAAVDASVWSGLPEPQRVAIDRIMSRAEDDDTPTNQQAIAAGFLSVLEELARQAPLLIAIDDVQWLDSSSARVIGFAARRLSGWVGVLATLRTEVDGVDGASWLQMPRPDAMNRVGVPTMSLGGLRTMIADRLGRSFSRPTLVRVMELSGGNPLFALELARMVDDRGAPSGSQLPNTLAESVRARLGVLDVGVREVLLAIACMGAPTVDLVVRATDGDAARVVGMLEDVEANGIIVINGPRVGFTHPLLAHGLLAIVSPARRRRVHRRLAAIVVEPELRARHLALAATSSDPEAVESLDVAAGIARNRGAPAAAAELLSMAIGLGGDTTERRIRLANHHLDAGDVSRARMLLEQSMAMSTGTYRAQVLNLLALVHMVDDSNVEAIGCLQRALVEVGDCARLRVQLLTTLSYCFLLAGDVPAGLHTAQNAVALAESLDDSPLLSQALSLRAFLTMVSGDGVDERTLHRALELEGRDPQADLVVRSSMRNVMILAWTGRLDRALDEMTSIKRRCLERGDQPELVAALYYIVIGEVWRGRFTTAAVVAEDAMERALQLGGDQPVMLTMTARATVYAYTGRIDEARSDIAGGLSISQRSGSALHAGWQLSILGFLELSLGNYESVISAVRPLIDGLQAAPRATEIFVGAFIPDAVEALVALGRIDEAEPLVAALEGNGARLDRAWMLAVGGRCRAMLHAARGDLDAASDAAQRAMVEHQRLPMPFERARTQLLLGQLLRRRKRKDAASTAMHESLATFETLGTRLWAAKARAALARSNVGPKTTLGLTPSERRVAELAASGMTNRDVAAELFISPKTVEANLSRIYHKLGIRSRAELGRRMGRLDE